MNELRIGQRIRVTTYRLASGLPIHQARQIVDSITEGVITKMERMKGSPNTILVVYMVGHSDHTVCVDIHIIGGLMLKDFNRGQDIEIMQRAPAQQALFERRAA